MTSYDNWKTSPPDPDPTCPECDGDLTDEGQCVTAEEWRRHLEEPDEYPEPKSERCDWFNTSRDDGPEDYVYDDYDEVEGKWKFYGPKGRR